MNQIFINSIEELQTAVRVPKSFPFGQLKPYLNDAYRQHIHYYIGPTLNGRLQQEPESILFGCVRNALGPLAMAMASPEIGVLMSDSGHLVKRDGNYTAANLDKVQRAERAMIDRGFEALAHVLSYLHELSNSFPEWEDSGYKMVKTEDLFLPNAIEFQTFGNILLPNSYLDYHALLPLIRETERKFTAKFRQLSAKLHAYMAGEEDNDLLQSLLDEARIWIAGSVARTNMLQQKDPKETVGRALRYRPSVDDWGMPAETAAEYYQGVVAAAEYNLNQLMAENEEELGIQVKSVSDFNSKDKHIFVL